MTFEKRLPEQFRNMSKEFYFNHDVQNEIILANETRILLYNYNWNTIKTLYNFNEALNSQPSFFVMNEDQNICMVSSFYDIIYVNMKQNLEVDVDQLYCIDQIRSIIHSDGMFYILVNK